MYVCTIVIITVFLILDFRNLEHFLWSTFRKTLMSSKQQNEKVAPLSLTFDIITAHRTITVKLKIAVQKPVTDVRQMTIIFIFSRALLIYAHSQRGKAEQYITIKHIRKSRKFTTKRRHKLMSDQTRFSTKWG